MAAYLIANYRITNPEAYGAYPSAVLPTLAAHGAEILVADYASEAIEGQPSSVTVVARFPSKEAARAWYDSPEYQAIVRLRTDNTEGFLVLADGFVMP
ncbi:MAG: DUF1330 domain-containing protein [Candidatus Binatia bacterium]